MGVPARNFIEGNSGFFCEQAWFASSRTFTMELKTRLAVGIWTVWLERGKIHQTKRCKTHQLNGALHPVSRNSGPALFQDFLQALSVPVFRLPLDGFRKDFIRPGKATG